MNARVALAFVALSACSSSGSGSGTAEPLPSDSTLCKLVIGYDVSAGATFSSPVYGTHSDDARAVLGEPAKRTDTEYTYDWCADAACTKHVSATLKFAKMDLCYSDTGKAIAPPYWLEGIDSDGFTRPKCWTLGSETPKACTECLAQGDITACK